MNRSVETRGLPQNLDAERFVLGSIMLDGDMYPAAAGILGPDDFSLEKHRRIFRRMGDVQGRGERVDNVTVANELMKFGELESCDGLTYLVSLDDGMPQVPNLDSYIRIVKDKSTLRRIIFSSQHMMNRCIAGEESPEEILTGAAETLRQLEDGIASDSGVTSTRDMIAALGPDRLLVPRAHGSIKLASMPRLDAALNGLNGGQMIVLLGETSRGKSSFALQVAGDVSMQAKSTVIWTMEMSPKSMIQRMVAQISRVPSWYTRLDADQLARHGMALNVLDANPIYFDTTSRTISQFGSKLRKIRGRVALVIVDYLQLIRSQRSIMTRAQQVSDNSRNLKLTAMDTDLPFLVLSQVDRSSVKGKDARIGLHSGKESGDIENDADVMLWIEAGAISRDQPTPASIVLGKQREGAAGFPISMAFLPQIQRFEEIE